MSSICPRQAGRGYASVRQYWRGLPRRPSPSSTSTIPKKDLSGVNRTRKQSRNGLPRQNRPAPAAAVLWPRPGCRPWRGWGGSVVDAAKPTGRAWRLVFALSGMFRRLFLPKKNLAAADQTNESHGEVFPGVVCEGCSQWPRYTGSTLTSNEVQAKTSLRSKNWIDPLRRDFQNIEKPTVRTELIAAAWRSVYAL